MIDVKHRIQILIIHRYVYMYVELYYEDLVLGSSQRGGLLMNVEPVEEDIS